MRFMEDLGVHSPIGEIAASHLRRSEGMETRPRFRRHLKSSINRHNLPCRRRAVHLDAAEPYSETDCQAGGGTRRGLHRSRTVQAAPSWRSTSRSGHPLHEVGRNRGLEAARFAKWVPTSRSEHPAVGREARAIASQRRNAQGGSPPCAPNLSLVSGKPDKENRPHCHC